MEIQLKTLTPLWTGGADGTVDRLHETGIIGSLRWWYEAIVRGLGGYACDPIVDGHCEYDPKKKEPLEKQLCPACYLFGATGWGRKFRLRISGGEKLIDGRNFLIPSGRVHGNRAGGWFVFSESRVGKLTFAFIPLRKVDLSPIYTILALAGEHASLGAKASNGYGVVRIENLRSALTWLNEFPTNTTKRNNTLPDFRDFFFAKFQFTEPKNNPDWWQSIEGIRQAMQGKLDDRSSPRPLKNAQKEIREMAKQGILPIAPAIRNWLRFTWSHSLSPEGAHFIFGEARAVCPHCFSSGFKPDRQNKSLNWCPNCKKTFKKGAEIPTTASKIYVSYAYQIADKWEFRIWGWLPCAGKIQNRDKFLANLKTQLTGRDIWQTVFANSGIVPQLTQWHALDCNQTDGVAYLRQLLGGAE